MVGGDTYSAEEQPSISCQTSEMLFVAVQSYSWLQPSRTNTQLPASVQRAMTAKAPATSADGENVRRFVNQASFRVSPGSSAEQQQADSSAGTPAQQQQGRRLAQVMSERT